MNCYCDPPLPIQQRTVTKSGNNFGKIYFSCPNLNCKFFCWIDDLSTMRYNNHNSSNSNSNRGGNSSSSSASSSRGGSVSGAGGKLTVMKLMIGEFVTGPPFQVWFDVQCPMDLKVRSFFESIPPDKKKLNSKTKMWSFNFEIYDQFVGSLLSTEYRSAIQVVEIPRFLLNGIRKFLSSEVAPQEISLLPGMMDTILPFQLEAVEFVVRRGGRALIADEMGCGKTIEAIAVLQQYRQHLPALILCPPSLTSQWKEELTKYCDELLEPKDICSLTTSTNRIYGKACIMPYSLLDRYVNTFSEERRFGIVIADESHNLKSKDAKRTCLALPLLKNAKVALCLTGTPAVNRPVELYTQLHGLLPEVFRDYEGFTNRYCDPKKPKFGPKMDVSGSSNEAELKNILEGMVMIRRLKSEVISNLPTKSREVRRVRPDPEYLPQLKALQDEMKGNKAAIYSASKSSDNNEFLNNQSRLMLTKLCGITGMSKISKVVMELELLIEEAREARKIEEDDEDIVLPERPKVEMIDVEPNIQNPLALGLIESDILSEISDPRVVDLTSERDLCSSVIHQDLETLPGALQEGLVDSDDEDIPLGLTRKRKCDSVAATCDNEDEDIFFCRRALGVKPKKKSKSGNKGEIADRNDFEEEQGGDWRDILDFSHANVKVGKAKRKKKEKQESVIATPVKPLGKKILVFAHHHDVLDAIESCARRKGVGYIRVDGTVTGSARSSLISRFQTDPEIDVAILSITACGTGLNLTCANVALFAELHWSVGYMLQAEDRIHRLGQKSKSVRIIYVLAEGSSDDIVWEQILRKHKILAATVGVDGGSLYASQKVCMVASKDLTVPDESQTTLDSYISSGQDNNSGSQELRKPQISSTQQISMDSFLAKKSPVTNIIDLERVEKEGISVVAHSNSPSGHTPKIPNPYATYNSASAMVPLTTPLINSAPVNDENNSGLESSMRVESKSSPLPPPLHKSLCPGPGPLPAKTGELSPSTIAKIEANRLKALARRNEILARQESHSSPLAPSIPTFIQPFTGCHIQSQPKFTNPAHHPYPPSMAEPQRPVQYTPLQPSSSAATTQIAQQSKPRFTNLPSDPTSTPTPFVAPHSSSSGYVFSTGTGNSLRITQDAIEKANNLISLPTNPNPMKKVTRSVD